MKLSRVALFAAAMTVSAGTMAANLSATAEVVDDYRFRGISQTGGDAALQGSLDLEFDNGIFLGIWGSTNIDFDDGTDEEFDYYVGYYGEINDMTAYDVSLNRYTYTNSAGTDYNELIGNLYYGGATLTYAWTDDYAASDEVGHYLAVGYDHVLADKYHVLENITASVHAGYSFGDYWDDLDIGDYSDYSVGVAADLYGFTVKAQYLFNDIDNDMEISSGAFRNDDTFLLSISRSFDLYSFNGS